MYVPTVGMNCETIPQNKAKGSQYGTLITSRNMAMNTALSKARMVRENRNPEIWFCTTVHVNRNRFCVAGLSHECGYLLVKIRQTLQHGNHLLYEQVAKHGKQYHHEHHKTNEAQA